MSVYGTPARNLYTYCHLHYVLVTLWKSNKGITGSCNMWSFYTFWNTLYLCNIHINYYLDMNIRGSVSILHNSKILELMCGILLQYKDRQKTNTTFYYLYIQVDSWIYIIFITVKKLNQKIFFSQMEMKDSLRLS